MGRFSLPNQGTSPQAPGMSGNVPSSPWFSAVGGGSGTLTGSLMGSVGGLGSTGGTPGGDAQQQMESVNAHLVTMQSALVSMGEIRQVVAVVQAVPPEIIRKFKEEKSKR